MGLIDHRFDDNFITTNLDRVLNWARQSSLWPMGFGLACCAIEMIATSTSRYRLTLKVLDLGFRQLGRSEFKLYAYPVLRDQPGGLTARWSAAAGGTNSWRVRQRRGDGLHHL